MPYVRKINVPIIDSESALIRSMEDKVYSGDAISVAESSDGETVISYINKDAKQNYAVGNYPYIYDDETTYTSYFGYDENGYACVFITFTSINQWLGEHPNNNRFIICLEVENFAKNKGGAHQCINVFENLGPGYRATINASNHGITYWYLDEIEYNVEYKIYIVASKYTFKHGMYRKTATKQNGQPAFPDDWEMRLWIRPTIRDASSSFPYTFFQKSLQDFSLVKYPINNELPI